MRIKSSKEVLTISATIILITIGTTFLIDGVLKNVIELEDANLTKQVIFFIIGLVSLMIAMMIAKTITDDLCKPDSRSFKEITQNAYRTTLRKTEIVITSVSEIRDDNGVVPNDRIKKCINQLFSSFSVEKICQTDYKNLKSELEKLNCDKEIILSSFSWQQQLRLIYQVTKFTNNAEFVIISSEQSSKQFPAFEHMLEALRQKLNEEQKTFTFSRAETVNFNEIDKVSKEIEGQIQLHTARNGNPIIMVDVTAGQKTYSLAAVLSTVDKKHVYTGYVDTNKPWPLHLQNIVNDNKSELAVG
ncbi:hypothetical protein [Thiomicrospira microaerophila]|uniref:hypothetical protein n=1 Tax=Thiomicrospira microaerophila TaxID=406020 RepID=UPI0005C875BF|nr:hypothetical protein [Thiomicrospira microaerophila]